LTLLTKLALSGSTNCRAQHLHMLNADKHKWLESALYICAGNELGESLCALDSSRVIGQRILSRNQNVSIEDVKQVLITKSASNENPLIGVWLVHAVSKDCQQSGDFVYEIINLEADTQLFLVQVIQDHHCRPNTSQGEAEKERAGLEEDCDVERSVAVLQTSPDLMQEELNRLKNENRDLLEKLSQSAADQLESLRKEITDTKCMNESLTKNWSTARMP